MSPDAHGPDAPSIDSDAAAPNVAPGAPAGGGARPEAGAAGAREESRDPDPAEDQPGEDAEGGDAPASVQITNVSYGGNQVMADIRRNLNMRDASGAGAWVRVKQGPIHKEEIDHARSVFAEPNWYSRARRSLHRGVALLYGPEGAGKRTAALNLLDELRLKSIVAFESSSDLTELDESDFQPGHGYLVDTLLEERARQLTRVQLDRLAHIMRSREAHLVVTLEGRLLPREVDAQYGVCCAAPDPIRVLRAQLSHLLSLGQLREQEATLLDERVRQSVAEVHQPRHVAELARELAEAARRGYAVDAALTAWRGRSGEEAPRLLARCSSADDRAMLLATAVFENHDYEVVVRQARRLRQLAGSGLGDPAERLQPQVCPLVLVERDEDPPDRVYQAPEPPESLFAPSREERLTAVDAWLLPAEVETTESGRTRLRRVRFRHVHTARAVLEHVWNEHDELRQTLLDWLGGVPFTSDLYPHVAGWVGQLIGASSGHEALDLLEQWARSNKASKRFMAAEALGVAAEDPVVGTRVQERLRQWENASQALRTTATLAYGHRFGLDRPKYAIQRLQWIASRLEGRGRDQILPIVLNSLARLRVRAARMPDVLREWTRWITSGQRTLREASIDALSRLLSEEASPARYAATRSRLLPVRAVREGYAEVLAELLRHAIDDRDAYRDVSEALFVWRDVGRERAPDDTEIAAAIEELVVELLSDVGSRGAVRLAVEVERDEERHARRAGEQLEEHGESSPEHTAAYYSESLRLARQVQELWFSESAMPDYAGGTDRAAEEGGVPTSA